MRIGELAARANVTVKAVRYYERIGLLEPARLQNGYRSFDDSHLRAVREIRELGLIGIAPQRSAPFLECLELGHERGDECVSALVVYRDAIAELDRSINALVARRHTLQDRLDSSAAHGGPKEPASVDHSILPIGLPAPKDDGSADHLPGLEMPKLTLPTSDGGSLALSELGTGRTVIYVYPLTGRPGVDLPEGWDAIPGARGCSSEACDFRDHFADLRSAGAGQVFGLSSQDSEYQSEVTTRLRLPFTMISDESFALGDALQLPTFTAPGHDRLYARLTLVIRDGTIEHTFYPIFPPSTHAQQVLTWLLEHPIDG